MWGPYPSSACLSGDPCLLSSPMRPWRPAPAPRNKPNKQNRNCLPSALLRNNHHTKHCWPLLCPGTVLRARQVFTMISPHQSHPTRYPPPRPSLHTQETKQQRGKATWPWPLGRGRSQDVPAQESELPSAAAAEASHLCAPPPPQAQGRVNITHAKKKIIILVRKHTTRLNTEY